MRVRGAKKRVQGLRSDTTRRLKRGERTEIPAFPTSRRRDIYLSWVLEPDTASGGNANPCLMLEKGPRFCAARVQRSMIEKNSSN